MVSEGKSVIARRSRHHAAFFLFRGEEQEGVAGATFFKAAGALEVLEFAEDAHPRGLRERDGMWAGRFEHGAFNPVRRGLNIARSQEHGGIEHENEGRRKAKGRTGLLLALGTPRGGASGDGFAAERSFVFGAEALPGPALMDEPGFGRVAEIFSDGSDGCPGHEADLLEEALALARGERSRGFMRFNAGAPKDFVRHPIANAWETLLEQENRFDGELAAAGEEFFH